MRLGLTIHSDSTCDAVSRIDVDVKRTSASALALHYTALGRIEDVLVPPPSAPARTDELWKHTCFEVFIRAGTVEPYIEFNFSPSTQWAAYSFARRRSGMRNIDVPVPPISIRSDAGRFELQTSIDVSRLPDLTGQDWLVGLTTIIEETSGRKSYWALAHPQGKPDFHAPEGFTLALPAAGST